jgi:hypothetical protein
VDLPLQLLPQLLLLISSAASSPLALSQALFPRVLSQLDPFPAALLPLTALVLLVDPTALAPLASPRAPALLVLLPLELLHLAWDAALSALNLSSLPVRLLLSLLALVLLVLVPLESPAVLLPRACVLLDLLLQASLAALLLLGLSLPLFVARKSQFGHSAWATRLSSTRADE